MNVLITGATGFIGSALLDTLLKQTSHKLTIVSRRNAEFPCEIDWLLVKEEFSSVDWRQSLHGIDTVVYLAARVHVMSDAEADPLTEFRRINTAATQSCATSG